MDLRLNRKVLSVANIVPRASVDGFFTHCGWNSTTQGISTDLPFLTFSIAIGQSCNSKII
ncbi:UDP-glycosyltransferase [Nymphaea thermarum]|nr:UDP-glycosyltransferase [Nymphaea thermarum]